MNNHDYWKEWYCGPIEAKMLLYLYDQFKWLSYLFILNQSNLMELFENAIIKEPLVNSDKAVIRKLIVGIDERSCNVEGL